jgi:hypothetical protein
LLAGEINFEACKEEVSGQVIRSEGKGGNQNW